MASDRTPCAPSTRPLRMAGLVARRPPERDDLGCGAREAVMTRDAYCLVVNPGARGRGMRRLPAVLGPLAAAGAQVRVEESSGLGHAATLAAEAADRQETVVAVGGDGTIGAMAAAVSAAGGVLGIIPAGRGNDFARMLGIPAEGAQLAAASRLPPAGLGYEVAGLRALLAWQPTAFTVDTGSAETRAM